MPAFYLPTHEWARQDGPVITIGLSAFAAGEVGDVIHVQLPAVGTTISRGKPCAEIESVKSVNDYYAPIDGVVTEINSALAANPELVNADAAGRGWFAKITPATASPLQGLLSEADYLKQTAK